MCGCQQGGGFDGLLTSFSDAGPFNLPKNQAAFPEQQEGDTAGAGNTATPVPSSHHSITGE